jgi:L-threonylcarbamoyladenylate synthase
MNTLLQISSAIAPAISILQANGLVAIPTETVYGLGANAYCESAVKRIFAAKNRPYYDPLILHVDTLEKVNELVTSFYPEAVALANAFWPGPLTLLLPKSAQVSNLVTANLPNLGIRIPNHPLTLSVLRELDFPVAAPSANPFNYVSPTTAQHVAQQLGNKIDYILDGGPSQVGIESTIVGFPGGVPTVYRLGAIAIEAIESIIGPVAFHLPQSSKSPLSAGQLPFHYSPTKALYLDNGCFETNHPLIQWQSVGFLGFNHFHLQIPIDQQRILSLDSDLNEAAQQLYSALRALDQLDAIDTIIAELVPNEGVGRAINDRIIKAAGRWQHVRSN